MTLNGTDMTILSTFCSILLAVVTVAANKTQQSAPIHYLSVSRSLQESLLPDFSVGDVVLTVVPSPANPTVWDIDLDYTGYNGSPVVTSSVALFQKDCITEIDLALQLIKQPQPDLPAQFPGDGTFHVDLEADISKIQLDSALWAVNEIDPTKAELAFCIRVDIFYEGILVNFAKTRATIDVTNMGDFAAFDGEVSVQSSSTLTASDDLTISYDVRVYPCDVNAVEVIAEAVAPGTAVRLCVGLADETLQTVYVQNVEEVSYSTDGVGPVPVITSGAPINSNLALVSCVAAAGGGKSSLIVWDRALGAFGWKHT